MGFPSKVNLWDVMVMAGKVLCPVVICPRCKKRPDAFSIHDRPKRSFRAVIGGVVAKAWAHVIVRKCPLCRLTFRQIPDWAQPYKGYVTDAMVNRGGAYTEVDEETYRGAAQQVYSDECGRDKGRGLSHVTVWRWVGAFGDMTELLRQARSLIRQKDPNSELFRKVLDVPQRKSRTQERHDILIVARQLFQTAREYAGLFGVSIFHELGTGGC